MCILQPDPILLTMEVETSQPPARAKRERYTIDEEEFDEDDAPVKRLGVSEVVKPIDPLLSATAFTLLREWVLDGFDILCVSAFAALIRRHSDGAWGLFGLHQGRFYDLRSSQHPLLRSIKHGALLKNYTFAERTQVLALITITGDLVSIAFMLGEDTLEPDYEQIFGSPFTDSFGVDNSEAPTVLYIQVQSATLVFNTEHRLFYTHETAFGNQFENTGANLCPKSKNAIIMVPDILATDLCMGVVVCHLNQQQRIIVRVRWSPGGLVQYGQGTRQALIGPAYSQVYADAIQSLSLSKGRLVVLGTRLAWLLYMVDTYPVPIPIRLETIDDSPWQVTLTPLWVNWVPQYVRWLKELCHLRLDTLEARDSLLAWVDTYREQQPDAYANLVADMVANQTTGVSKLMLDLEIVFCVDPRDRPYRIAVILFLICHESTRPKVPLHAENVLLTCTKETPPPSMLPGDDLASPWLHLRCQYPYFLLQSDHGLAVLKDGESTWRPCLDGDGRILRCDYVAITPAGTCGTLAYVQTAPDRPPTTVWSVFNPFTPGVPHLTDITSVLPMPVYRKESGLHQLYMRSYGQGVVLDDTAVVLSDLGTRVVVATPQWPTPPPACEPTTMSL